MNTSVDAIPFEIVEHAGKRYASNGNQRVALLDGEGRMFRRRGVKGIAACATADVLLPKINQFAGELLAHADMPAREARDRLLAIAGLVPDAEPERVEWLVVELAGARVYCDGETVVVTQRDLVI